MTKQITPRQCKQARSLLKWNLQDLANKSKLLPKAIERFEKSMGRFTMPEMDAVCTTFKKEGIIFLDNMEVVLAKDEVEEAYNPQDPALSAYMNQKVHEVTDEELHGNQQQEKAAQIRLAAEQLARKTTPPPPKKS